MVLVLPYNYMINYCSENNTEIERFPFEQSGVSFLMHYNAR